MRTPKTHSHKSIIVDALIPNDVPPAVIAGYIITALETFGERLAFSHEMSKSLSIKAVKIHKVTYSNPTPKELK